MQLVSGLTKLDLTKKQKLFLFVSSEAVEYILVKLETSCTVILPQTPNVLWRVRQRVR